MFKATKQITFLSRKPWEFVKECLCVFSCIWHFVTPWTVAHQLPLSIEFSRQEYWSGFPISFFRGSSWPRDWNCISCISCISRQILVPLRHLGRPCNILVQYYTYIFQRHTHMVHIYISVWWPMTSVHRPRTRFMNSYLWPLTYDFQTLILTQTIMASDPLTLDL